MQVSDIVPEPASRVFICAATGAGKSTFSEVLMDAYRRKYPTHQIYIFDPKPRFLPIDPGTSRALFPQGYEERIHKRRQVVPINGERVRRPHKPAEDGRVWLYTDYEAFFKLCEWFQTHPTAHNPALIVLDESMDIFDKRGQADRRFRRLMQQGRALGVGVWCVNQEPVYIDGSLLRQTEYLFIGELHNPDDRAKLYPHCSGTPLAEHLIQGVPRYSWLCVNRRDWAASSYFRLQIKDN